MFFDFMDYSYGMTVLTSLKYEQTIKKKAEEFSPSVMKKIKSFLTAKEIQRSEYLLFLCSMPQTNQMHKEKLISSLLPYRYQHLIVTCGRGGKEAMERVLGKAWLPILSNQSRLAKLLMIKAHESETGLDHR